MSLAPSPATGLLGTIVMWTETTCALTRLHISQCASKTPIQTMHVSIGCKSQNFRSLMLVKETLIHFDPAIPEELTSLGV